MAWYRGMRKSVAQRIRRTLNFADEIHSAEIFTEKGYMKARVEYTYNGRRQTSVIGAHGGGGGKKYGKRD